jgi:glutaredoxin 3
LEEITGQDTVPNIFIGGQHVGGCDDIHRMHGQGKLTPMLDAGRK